MRKTNQTMPWSAVLSVCALAALLLAGRPSAGQPTPASQPQTNVPTAATPAPVASAPATPGMAAPDPTKPQPIVRIKAGATAQFKDSDGNVWLPDQGFTDGETVERSADLKIQNTKDPALYLTERYGMSAFSCPVLNGKYLVKLHFAETYEDITGAGQRVFSVKVQGHEIKDLDVFAKAGGALRAHVESVPVEVTDGKVQITFTESVQSAEINGIEILPQP
jgi:hypothetical protein